MKKTVLFAVSLFLLLSLTSCAPVVYKISASPEVYAWLEEEPFFQRLPEAGGYTEARIISSEKKYSLIILNAASNAETHASPKNAFSRFFSLITGRKDFCLADIALSSPEQQTVKKGAFSPARPFGTVALTEGEAEISRYYLYPCIPFDKVDQFKAYAPISSGAGKLASAADCEFYSLDEIPSGMVILPVIVGDVQYLAGDEDYPLYESSYVCMTKNRLPASKEQTATEGGSVIRTAEDAINTIEKQESGVKYAEMLYRCYDAACDSVDAFFKSRIAAVLKEKPVMPKVFFMAGAGDMMMGRGADWEMMNADAPDPVFRDTLPILRNSSITLGNLEGPVTTSSVSINKTFVFKYRPEILKYLRQAGFNYLKLNNTHIWDYGETGLKDTLKALSDEGFATSGVGKNEEEASRFYRTNIQGYAVSILSVAASHLDPYNTNRRLSAATAAKAGILWESDSLADVIRDEKKTGAIIVINVHGGNEYSAEPSAEQQILYRKLCDAGADVVFGSHPHVLQPVEWYGNSLIVWSLGNFMYPGMEDIAGTASSMIVRVGFVNGRLLYYEKYPTSNVGTHVSLVKE